MPPPLLSAPPTIAPSPPPMSAPPNTPLQLRGGGSGGSLFVGVPLHTPSLWPCGGCPTRGVLSPHQLGREGGRIWGGGGGGRPILGHLNLQIGGDPLLPHPTSRGRPNIAIFIWGGAAITHPTTRGCSLYSKSTTRGRSNTTNMGGGGGEAIQCPKPTTVGAPPPFLHYNLVWGVGISFYHNPPAFT